MAHATEYPLTMFGTAGRALRLLEDVGVNPQHFLQRLIDDSDFRTAVAVQFDPSIAKNHAEPEWAVITDIADPDRVYALVEEALKYWSYLSEDELAAAIARFSGIEGLRQLAVRTTKHDFDVLADRIGLYTTHAMSRREVGRKYGLSENQVRTREERAMHGLRYGFRYVMSLEDAERERAEAEERQDIWLLGLSDRVLSLLRRAKIDTIPVLITKSADDLYNHTGFGEKSIEEVRTKLDQRGLKLAGE